MSDPAKTPGSQFVTVDTDGGVGFIASRLPGLLDSDEFDRLNQSLLEVLDRDLAGRWVLDLTAVDYMGSSVLGLMVNLRQHVKSGGGKLVLCGMSRRLSTIFRTCCLEKLFVIKHTRDDAAAALLK